MYSVRTVHFALFVSLFILLPLPLRAATYYVSLNGDDSRSGLSPNEAWRSVARVNRHTFSAGDRICFQRGGTFRGPLVFDKADSGRPDAPVVVGSFGQESRGNARIDAGDGRGIVMENTSGIHITDLVIEGVGADTNLGSGILAYTTGPQGASHLRIDNVTIFGFGKHGISIGAWKTETGYDDVQITRAITHDNLRTGIFTWGPWGNRIYAHTNVSIAYCSAYNAKGGSGITLSSVDGGIVERCVAHHNGEEFSGAVGIWAWDSNDILLQFNESYSNRTIGADGDGFDFDGGVTNSTMQYNYAHDNDAAGFLVAQYPGAPQPIRNIVIRYNISENDSRKRNYGAIHVWNGDAAEQISDVHIYQNTVFLSSSVGNSPSAISFVSPTGAISVQNNLFLTHGGERLVSVVPGQNGVRFQNNAYWSGGAPFTVNWKGRDYNSLALWLKVARNQERIGSQIVAVHADPALANPGSGGTLGTADLLPSLTGYMLRADSPLLGRGINLLNSLGIDPGAHGFFGHPISQAADPSIGASMAALSL